ncbi:Crp/Fnr family transcriptional regulator [Limibacter armeniacum]|uniref:Crp/Fnr family transcriptional regulator n=1 Tax=Limibacter armeniacum TaxID=466084 RepID=UPI002FE52F9B
MEKEQHIAALKLKFESYAPISDASWSLIESIIDFKSLEKNEILLKNGQVAKNVYFVCKGALRAYVTDYNGNIYNKNIFLETDFAGSTVSYLLSKPSNFTLEALEDNTILISLNYQKYRRLIEENIDLKNFYIAYLENNWVIEKEQREISIVMQNATERYLDLLSKHPNIDQRIQQLHIASHLGITPTQLSRIRKDLKKSH